MEMLYLTFFADLFMLAVDWANANDTSPKTILNNNEGERKRVKEKGKENNKIKIKKEE